MGEVLRAKENNIMKEDFEVFHKEDCQDVMETIEDFLKMLDPNEPDPAEVVAKKYEVGNLKTRENC